MRDKNNPKNYILHNSLLVLVCLILAIAVEPFFKGPGILAVSQFELPRVNYGINLGVVYDNSSFSQPATQEHSHAPEPGTMLLILSGLGGMVIRFAQRSFAKFKRITDFFLSVAGIMFSLPVFTLAALMIKFSSKGPVIYKQERVGLDGRVFTIYKLRTMYLNAESGTGAVWAKQNDARITNIGMFLRKTHIDELPQLFNVVKGEMSIVGPRPERPQIVKDLKIMIHDYEKRLRVRPGITGLAQVVHKYDETIDDVRRKIKFDLMYIRKMCWLVEVRIMALTVFVALTGKGAR